MIEISQAEQKIAKEFFKDYTTGGKVSRVCYPDSFKSKHSLDEKNKNDS